MINEPYHAAYVSYEHAKAETLMGLNRFEEALEHANAALENSLMIYGDEHSTTIGNPNNYTTDLYATMAMGKSSNRVTTMLSNIPIPNDAIIIVRYTYSLHLTILISINLYSFLFNILRFLNEYFNKINSSSNQSFSHIRMILS